MVGVGVGWWARGRAGARARGRVGAWAARFRPPGAHGARAQPRQGITARRRSLANPGPPQSWRIVVRFLRGSWFDRTASLQQFRRSSRERSKPSPQ